MTAYYPTSIKTFTVKADYTTTVLAEHVNSLQDEVNAIEVVLGTYLTTSSGWTGSFDQSTTTWNTLKDRISNIEYGLNLAYNRTVPAGGTTGQVLVKNSGTDYDASWVTSSFLPSQSGNSGKYLTTNGSSASWATISTTSGETISSLLLIGA
jgi:hypothetical protein